MTLAVKKGLMMFIGIVRKFILLLGLLAIIVGLNVADGNFVSYASEPSNWAKPMIEKGIEQGLVHRDLLSDYQNSITRAEFCKLLVHIYVKETGHKDIYEFMEIMDRPINEYTYPFKDIDYENDDSDYIIVANILGFTGGTSKNTFSPNAKLTREQAAKIIFGVFKRLNAAKGLIYDNVYADDYKKVNIKFSDDNKLARWAKEDVYQISNLKIMNGVGDNKFEPSGIYTKEQAIITAVKMCDVYSNMLEDYKSLKDGSVKKKGNVKIDDDDIFQQTDITDENNNESPEVSKPTINNNNDLTFEQDSEIDMMKKEVFELTNKERKKYGLRPFKECEDYDFYADIRAEEIGVVMGHERPDGSSWFSGISGYSMVAENVAGGQKTPQEVVDAWMHSQGHRENILDPKLEQLTVGISKSEHGWDWVQIFYTPLNK